MPSDFYYAVREGNFPLVELLIKMPSTDVNEVDSRGVTPLHWVSHCECTYSGDIKCSCTKIVKILIEHGADLNRADRLQNQVSLHWAVTSKHTGAVELLIKADESCINAVSYLGNTPLHLACKAGLDKISELLLEHGAKVHAVNMLGNTALHLAVGGKEIIFSSIVVGLLLAYGARVRCINNKGRSALHLAAKKDNAEVAGLLLAHGVNINRIDDDGKTALQIASSRNNIGAAKLLIIVILLRNPSSDKPTYVKKNSVLSEVWDEYSVNISKVVQELMRCGCHPARACSLLSQEFLSTFTRRKEGKVDSLRSLAFFSCTKIPRLSDSLSALNMPGLLR